MKLPELIAGSAAVAALLAQTLLFTPSASAGKTAETAIKSCLSELGLPAKACNCIGRRAEAEFNQKQQRFFIAAIKDDQKARVALSSSLTPDEMTEIATFMSTAPEQCAGQ